MSTSGNITLNIDGLVTDINGIRGQVAALESRRYIVEESHDGTEWYRKWSDGWIEQGGSIITSTSSGNMWNTVTFSVPFADTNYTVIGSYEHDSHDQYMNTIQPSTKTASSCKISNHSKGGTIYWYACGY